MSSAVTDKQDTDSDVSVYVAMSDGVNIAVDVWLPEAAIGTGVKVPVMVEFTRYWRAKEGKGPRDRVLFFPKLGFAHAVVDCRGSGASFGARHVEHSVAEVKDFAQIINWLAMQPWSNGNVVTIGSSYSANTAELAMLDAPVALKASIPRFSDFDIYNHLLFPGGLCNKVFTQPWGEGVYAMDMNCIDDGIHPLWNDYLHACVKPVGSDQDHALLKQAIAEHQANRPLHEYLAPIEYRDDFHFTGELGQQDEQWMGPYLIQDNHNLRQVPSYHWASFNDAGTAAGAIARFMGSNAPMRVIIGYWSHGGLLDTNPYRPINQEAEPSFEMQFVHIAKYLSALQEPAGDYQLDESALYYFTAGEEVWKKTDVWPPKGVSTQRWYLSEENSLTLVPPTTQTGKDQYRVDFRVGTGAHTRWNQLVPELHYGDRVTADKRLLIYTSIPLKNAIEITGHPVIYLQLSSTQKDGAVIVYLEAVAPDGSVTMLTEGGLRLIHRKVSNEVPPYPVFGPYHTFERKDAMPMPIGERVEVGFELLPLSVRIEKGHALRVAIAGHDKDCFERLPPEGEQTYEIFHHSGSLSYIDLPVQSMVDSTGKNKIIDPFLTVTND